MGGEYPHRLFVGLESVSYAISREVHQDLLLQVRGREAAPVAEAKRLDLFMPAAMSSNPLCLAYTPLHIYMPPCTVLLFFFPFFFSLLRASSSPRASLSLAAPPSSSARG